MRKYIICALIFVHKLYSQSNLALYNEFSVWNIYQDELFNKHSLKSHLSIRPYFQHRFLSELKDLENQRNSEVAEWNYEYFRQNRDSIAECLDIKKKGKKFLKYFNTNPGHFFSVYTSDYYFVLDPIIRFDIGKEKYLDQNLFINTRGIRFKAGIDHKLFLFSELTENQILPLSFIQDYSSIYKAIPGATFVKSYSSSLFHVSKGFDYLMAEAGVIYKLSKSIDLSFNHNRNSIGVGIRSLLLSDFAAPNFNFQIRTQMGRVNYINTFSELSRESRFIQDTDRLLQKKYSATHYLSIDIFKNWNIGLFETVIFNRKRGFELQYLNPIILYRAVEQAIGSPDNVLLGLQSQIHLFRKFSFYGQIILDEFVFKRLFSNNNGWWANKYGFQLGLKYPNFFKIRNLHLQLEYNTVRPFTYSYSDSMANYSHYHQSLAHPLGSNFREYIGRIIYHPNGKFNFEFCWMNYKKGLDTLDFNYGGNILKDNSTRFSDYNNKTTQGLLQKVNLFTLRASYEILMRTWLDLSVGVRNLNSEQGNNATPWIQAGIRMNLNYRTDLL